MKEHFLATPDLIEIVKNKDRQRMMVDPMFRIVKNLRLFLTAVTPTAITPTAVIL